MDNLSLSELLDLFSSFYGQKADPAQLLEEVQLSEKAKSRVDTLSGGQKQRFSIATALVNKPKVIFLDEPTTGLDPQARRNLWELVKSLKNKWYYCHHDNTLYGRSRGSLRPRGYHG